MSNHDPFVPVVPEERLHHNQEDKDINVAPLSVHSGAKRDNYRHLYILKLEGIES